MRDIQLGKNETVFTVSVRCLIEVHEIHIDLIIGKLLIGLCMQVQKRLSEFLQALDPHLGGREGMHPCDHTYAVVITCNGAHIFYTDLGCLNGGKKLDADHVLQLFVKEIHHLTAVFSNLPQTFFTIKILAAGNEIQFFHF